MRACYFDCVSGISGDMVLGALLDVGLPLEGLVHELGKLRLDRWSISPETVVWAGIRATFAGGSAEEGHHHRHNSDIVRLIEESDIPQTARSMALRVFCRLGEAESRVHGVPLSQVHFHEVGATDSIVDIVGCCLALEALGIEEVRGSPLPWTRGTVKVSHGVMPLPAPATVELMRGWPVEPLDIEAELVTPTGAAIVTALASGAGMPAMSVEAVGYGAGRRELEGRPNVLRAVIGETSADLETDTVMEIECNLDDMNPEWLPQVMDRVMASGALDVFLSPLTMKKGRPGFKMSALCLEDRLTAVTDAVLRNTTSLGVRYRRLERFKLRRQSRAVPTPWGPVEVKLGFLGSEQVNAAPEYEDCRRVSDEFGVPLKEVYAAALRGLQLDG